MPFPTTGSLFDYPNCKVSKLSIEQGILALPSSTGAMARPGSPKLRVAMKLQSEFANRANTTLTPQLYEVE
jgi:hypothetical protein